MHSAIGLYLMSLFREGDMAVDRLVEIFADTGIEPLAHMCTKRVSNIKMMSADLNLHENLSGSHRAIVAGDYSCWLPLRLCKKWMVLIIHFANPAPLKRPGRLRLCPGG